MAGGCNAGNPFLLYCFEHYISLVQQWSVAACILITLINCGAIMEQRHWVVYLEVARLVIAGGILLLVYPTLWLAMAALIVIALLAVYFEKISKYYLQWIYAQ